MYIKPLRKWLRRNPGKALLIAVVAFLIKELPPYVSDVWALGSDRPLATVIREELSDISLSQFSISWITTPLGLGALFAIIVLLLTGKREAQTENDRIAGLNDEHAKEMGKLSGEKAALEKELGDLREHGRNEDAVLIRQLTTSKERLSTVPKI